MFLKGNRNEGSRIFNRQFQRDEENRIIVNMTVKDDSNFLSLFSANAVPVIGAEVADFIEHITVAIPPKEELTLRIHSDCIDDDEKVLYRKAIKEYYSEKYVADTMELKRNNIVALFLFLAGVAVLALALLFEYRIGNPIWGEVIDIVAWVLLWEAVDIVAFGNRALQRKRRHYLAYVSMKIEYIDL